MKISLALGRGGPLSRSTAWGCLTSNLALPGTGSLMAGRRVGYPQLLLATVGFLLTVLTAVPFLKWYFENYSRLRSGTDDPFSALGELFRAMRYPLLGIGIFLVAGIWALLTSLAIVQNAREAERKSEPPRLQS